MSYLESSSNKCPKIRSKASSKNCRGLITIWILAALVIFSFPLFCEASTLEISGDFSFYQKNYGGGSFEWSRHWGASIGYFILPSSEIQFSVEDDFSKTVISGSGDTALHDQNYSVDWIQALVPKNWFAQPYFKVGIGQLTRVSIGSYVGEVSQPETYTTVSQTVGAGLRIYLSQMFSIKTEVSTYFPLGQFSSWQDNINFNSGFSFYF